MANHTFNLDYKLFIINYLIVLFMTGCTKADIHYPVDKAVTGYVRICPDISGQTLGTVAYHFYRTDGAEEQLMRMCDGSGNWEGSLPAGQYRAAGVNTNVANVELEGMNKYETATARVKQTTIRLQTRDVFYLLSEPDNLYSVLSGVFDAVPGDVVTRNPIPRLLTRSLTIRFELGGGLQQEVTAIEGIIRGVYPAVNLSTGMPVINRVDDVAKTGMQFDTQPEATGFVGVITLFGIANPQNGTNYDNYLTATFTLTNGQTERVDIDLNDVLTGLIGSNQGVIPLEVPLRIEIGRTAIGLTAEVTEWIESGNAEKEL